MAPPQGVLLLLVEFLECQRTQCAEAQVNFLPVHLLTEVLMRLTAARVAGCLY